MSWLLGIFRLLRKIDAIVQLESSHRAGTAEIKQALLDLDKRLSRLEHREDIVVNEAKSAARAGAQDIMTGFAADIIRRVTLLEADSSNRVSLSQP